MQFHQKNPRISKVWNFVQANHDKTIQNKFQVSKRYRLRQVSSTRTTVEGNVGRGWGRVSSNYIVEDDCVGPTSRRDDSPRSRPAGLVKKTSLTLRVLRMPDTARTLAKLFHYVTHAHVQRRGRAEPSDAVLRLSNCLANFLFMLAANARRLLAVCRAAGSGSPPTHAR